MAETRDSPITLLLRQWNESDRSAERRPFDAFYTELKQAADRLMASEWRDHVARDLFRQRALSRIVGRTYR